MTDCRQGWRPKVGVEKISHVTTWITSTVYELHHRSREREDGVITRALRHDLGDRTVD